MVSNWRRSNKSIMKKILSILLFYSAVVYGQTTSGLPSLYSVQYNPTTTNYYILGTSVAGVTSSCIETALPSDTVTITAGSISGSTLTATASNTWSTGCVLTLSGFGGSYTGLNGQIVAVSATGLSGSSFQVPVVGSFTAGSTGAGVAQVTYNLTGQLRHEPFFAGHGTVTNGSTSNYTIADAVTNYATTAHPFSPAVTGHPGFLIIESLGIQDLSDGVALSTMESGMQSLWSAARADNWTGIVQVTLMGYDGGGLFGAPQSQWVAFNDWLRAQGPTSTTVAAGQYWDKIVYLDSVLPNAFDTNYFISGQPHMTDAGNQVTADLLNQAFGVQGTAVNPYSPNLNPSLSCQPGIGDGLNAMPAATYLQTTCRNLTGQTWTITSISCVADSGSSTCNVTNGAGTSLLTGAITGTSTYTAGTQSSTVTIAPGDYLKATFITDGTTRQMGLAIGGFY
jgi:hypothetical protein